jgi:cell division protein FtsW
VRGGGRALRRDRVRVLLRLSEEDDLFTILAATRPDRPVVGQAFINIMVNLQLFPSKGMTLPLISYGGSSMIALCLGIGSCWRSPGEIRS